MITVFVDCIASLSLSIYLTYSLRCTSHLVRVQRVSLQRGARFSLVCLFALKIPSSRRWQSSHGQARADGMRITGATDALRVGHIHTG